MTLIVPANGEEVLNVTAKFFAVISATAGFDIEFDHNGRQSLEQGDHLGGEKYKRIRFFETSGSTNTIKFYAGDSDFIPPTNVKNTVNAVITAQDATPAQFLVNGDIVDGRIPFVAASRKFRWAMVLGKKDLAGTNNASSVFVGISNANGEQPLEIIPGQAYAFPVPAGEQWDFLNFFFIVASDGDGVVVIYTP